VNRQWWFGLLSGVALVLIVVTGVAARGRSSLVVAAALPVIALLAGIGRRLWELRQRDLDNAIAVDVADLARQFAAATNEAYRPDLARQTVAMVDGLFRRAAEVRGAPHDPAVAAKLTAEVSVLWAKIAVSHAAAHPGVIRARNALAADLVRKRVAEHPVAFCLAPVGALFSDLVYRPLTSLLLLGSISFGGLVGLGLADLYYAGNLFLKILAGLVATSVLWVVFAVMKFVGLLDRRGWMALLGYVGAAMVIALHVGAMLHWPWWGGPLVGTLFVVAGLVAQPPSVFGVAANPYTAGPPALGPPGVGIFPPTPPH